ncbi:phosphotransferase [Actinoplanes sp. NPDC048791]|uniref:phosphotransferase n=1 Tax=Actinoplanes sp. NPDC048791 TaxID=3154623 RepID=UPI0034080526
MTAAPVVPADVLANVRQRWPEIVDAWASHVGTEFQTLCDQYRATSPAVLPARYGYVVAVDTLDGPLVFRSSPDPRGPDQAAVAAALANLGISPTVHQTLATDHGTWTVLDRVLPGTSLIQSDPAAIRLDALFSPLAAMHHQPAPRAGMPSILDWLSERLTDDNLTDLRPGTTIAPADERETALNLLAELARDHIPGLCHGDASMGNLIASGTDRWMLIDPRGMTGESAYDVAVLAIRAARIHDSVNLIPHIAKLADVTAERVRTWMAIANAARV